MKYLLASFLLLTACMLPEASAAPEKDDPATRGRPVDSIVAVVGDDVILESELASRVRQLTQTLRDRGTELPPRDIFRKQVLDRLIDRELQIQWAKRVGMTIGDDQLNQAINSIARNNNMTLEELPKALMTEDVSYREFREQVREDILLQQVREYAVERNVTVMPQEVEEYLQKSAKSGGDQQYQIAHILMSLGGQASPYEVESIKRRINELREQIQNGELSFTKAAVAYSDGQQALEGGDLGWRSPAELPSLFSDLVVSMQIGEVSEPIRSGSGFHLVKLVDAKRPERIIATETHARHILLKPSAILSKEDAIRQLQELKQRIEAGEDFAELAIEFSDDPGSAVQGGDLGWQPPGTFDPTFQEVLDSLDPGEISEPFETQFGIHLAQLLDRRETDFTERVQKNQAYQAIVRRKTEEQFPIWLQKQHDDTFVDIRLDD